MKSLKIFVIILFYTFCISINNISYAKSDDTYRIILDDEISLAIAEVTNPMFIKNQINPNEIQIQIIDTNDINAFSTSGNRIFLFRGLLTRLENPYAITSIIAHEFGHIKQGHIARRSDMLNKSFDLESISLAALFGAAAIVSGNPGLAPIALMTAQSSYANNAIQFSRAQENSADSIAIRLIENAKYDIGGFIEAFQCFADEYNSKGEDYKRIISYYSTHPSPEERLEKLENRKRIANKNTAPLNNELIIRYERAIAKLKAISTDPLTLISMHEGKDSFNDRYSMAIAYMEMNEFEKSKSIINQLIEEEPQNPFLYEFKSNIDYCQNNLKEQLYNLKKAHQYLKNESSNITVKYALALSEYEKSSESKKKSAIQFIELLSENRRDPFVFLSLAKMYSQNDQLDMSHFALSEMYYNQYNIEMAKKHFNFGVQMIQKDNPQSLRKMEHIKSLLSNI